MGQGDRHSRGTPNPKPDQIRTPDKPASSSSSTKLKRPPARLGSLVDTPTTTPVSAPSTASSTARSSKKSFGLSAQGQPTLTQIDFVKRSQTTEPDDDDEFDYIGEAGGNAARNAQEVVEIDDDEEGTLDNDGDTEYRPPTTSKPKRTHSVKFENGPANTKKSSNEKYGSSKKGRRKTSDKKDDKTLTQMSYVQRIVVDPDEELKMEYAYITPKKKDPERHAIPKREAEDAQQDQPYGHEPLNQHKKRKLSPILDLKRPGQLENKEWLETAYSPATPRKTTKTEIPSSQSPESPGIAFITSSQFRHNTRSPQKRDFQPLYQPYIKEESPEQDGLNGTHKAPDKTSQFDPMSPSPSRAQHKSTEHTPEATRTEHQAAVGELEMSSPQHRPSSTHRTVIYETDADTDYSELEDDLLNVPSSPQQESRNADDQAHDDGVPNSLDIESQDLPPPPLPEQDVDLGHLLPESTLLSDASILYQRIHAATQFPLDPVPTINTQKMAELFPDDSTGLHSLTAPSQPSTPMKPPSVPNPTESQTQSESQGAGGMQTEVIPESSPVAQHETPSRFDLSVRDVVVQVESSQPVDRIQRRKTEGHDAARRGILSRSQLLSSSVMESVPIPVFWMSSQDSIGEPYVLPEP
ncbi:hypothetical protein BJX63DRAFT_381379 [Aspergillus granulosus]|uniref:Uncharacterized protein n=1 Tax=Aspergillus granulosus TaxID=176169 RepID=A0ABR4HVY7_9EURO